MAKTEIYRSFDGLLNADTREGYIIYDNGTKDTYTIEWLNVYQDVADITIRVPKESLPTFDDANAISEMIDREMYRRGEEAFFRMQEERYNGTRKS